MKIKKKILFLVTEDWYFCSHRMSIARAVRDMGCEVVIATRVKEHATEIKKEGFKLIPIRLKRSNKNPVTEIVSVIEIILIYISERPDVVHHVAIKPVIYGSVAAIISGIKSVVNALAGLGYIFTSGDYKARLLRPFIKLGLSFLLRRSDNRVIIQNTEDRQMMVKRFGIPQKNIILIRGSGVDTNHFIPVAEPQGIPLVVLVARMLWDKGIREFVEAAKIIKGQKTDARFILVGSPDVENPSSIPKAQLLQWQAEGIIQWWGYRDDIAAIWAQAHIAVLPSYREGLPKALLEAASCGRPIVTTDTTGCREIVKHGENGLLVPVQNITELARAIDSLIKDENTRKRMGLRGRQMVESEFSEQIVINAHLAAYQELLSSTTPRLKAGA
ncbi:MAG: glycosyltransferase family 4 protein [Nitrospirae bacterium]|nr:glycosyltransferase family 4 protein [Nitrospirota bacterium]